MSLLPYHEDVSLDSLQDRLFWYDDFEGDQLKDEWALTVSGGSGAIVDEITGAAYRLTCATLNHWAYLSWGDIRTLLVSKQCAFEFRTKVNDISLVWYDFRLDFDDSNRLIIEHDTLTDTTIHILSEDGGAQTDEDTGTTLNTDWHNCRIQTHIHGSNHAHYYYDDSEFTNSPITTNIPGEHLQPYIRMMARETANKTVTIDYVAVRQER